MATIDQSPSLIDPALSPENQRFCYIQLMVIGIPPRGRSLNWAKCQIRWLSTGAKSTVRTFVQTLDRNRISGQAILIGRFRPQLVDPEAEVMGSICRDGGQPVCRTVWTNHVCHARGKRPSACSVLTTSSDTCPIGTLHDNPVPLFAFGNDISPRFRALFS
jgi:hypothetical protein